MNIENNQAFQLAVIHNNLSKMQSLLQAGADINAYNHLTETALLQLLKKISCYNHEICLTHIQWLLQQGADPNIFSSSRLAPLQQAIQNIQRVPSDFKEIEYDAVIFPHSEMQYEELTEPQPNIFKSIKLLIQYGADILHIGENGWSILETALSCKHRETIRYLLSQNIKFDIHQFNPNTSMTLFQFARSCCLDILPDLLEGSKTINDKRLPLFTGYSANPYPCQYQVHITDEILYLGQENTHEWRILPWRQGFSFQRFETGRWVDAAHHCEIALLSYRKYWFYVLNTNAYIWLQQQIPAEIIERVEGLEFGQPLMLHWIATMPYAQQKTEHSTLLLWLLAGLYTTQPGKYRQYPIDDVLTWSQRKITQFLGGYGTKNEPIILQRIQCEPGKKSHWNIICEVLEKGILVRMRHLNTISVELLKAILLYPWIANSARLMEYYTNHSLDLYSPEKMAFLHQIRSDILNIGDQLNIADCEIVVNHCKHPEEIHQLHQRWLTRLLKQITPEKLKDLSLSKPFPSPPVPGNQYIKHIADGLALMQESLNMAHCVSAYMEQAYAGKCFFYHIEHAQPATLELTYDEDKSIRLNQLMAKNNHLPNKIVRKIVRQWRKKHHIKLINHSNQLLTQDEIEALLS